MKKLLLFSIFTLLAYAIDSEQSKEKIACVKGLSANLRSEASLKGSVVVNLNKYTPLTILEEKENWTKVKSKNFQGWLFNDLLVKNIKCVMALQPDNTIADIQTEEPHSNRSQVEINEGFKIIQTTLVRLKLKINMEIPFGLKINIYGLSLN
jgi:uncharacterized protein YgiM (DUF1202 family)